MNGTKTPENTPFYTLDTEKTPRATFKKTKNPPYALPYVNEMYEVFNPKDLTEYSP